MSVLLFLLCFQSLQRSPDGLLDGQARGSAESTPLT